MYISLTKGCNAHCKFCVFTGEEIQFDFEKFKLSIGEILRAVPINKLSFTGGEPTLQLDMMIKCLEYVKSVSKYTFTVVNTNGVKLKQLEGIHTLDNIALSRHDILDRDNQDIFGTKTVPTLDDIESFKDKQKLHLSCNIIRGHIDSQERIFKYLDTMSNVGAQDFGFVSLMPINKYATENGIDFDKIPMKYSEKFISNKETCYKEGQ
jgi:molybdenum cofactor biosynthesis enzyme MoaA